MSLWKVLMAATRKRADQAPSQRQGRAGCSVPKQKKPEGPQFSKRPGSLYPSQNGPALAGYSRLACLWRQRPETSLGNTVSGLSPRKNQEAGPAT